MFLNRTVLLFKADTFYFHKQYIHLSIHPFVTVLCFFLPLWLFLLWMIYGVSHGCDFVALWQHVRKKTASNNNNTPILLCDVFAHMFLQSIFSRFTLCWLGITVCIFHKYYNKCCFIGLSGLDFHEDLHRIGAREGLKGRKLQKAMESYAWNITVLKVCTFSLYYGLRDVYTRYAFVLGIIITGLLIGLL